MFRRYGPAVAAFLWRRAMFRTCFVAVTGSYGKSTAARCLGAILSQHGPTNWTDTTSNSWRALARWIRRTRFRHRFTLMEVGTRKPGALRRAAWMIAPDVVVVLAVGRMHTNEFPDLAAIAAEKAQLLSRLPRSGLAILNADDPYVLAMREGCRGRVLTFGAAPENDLWFSDVTARWPDTLSFRAHYRTTSCEVSTRMVGRHWLPSVAGALLAGVALGVPLEGAAAAIRDVQPVENRMQPAELPNGAVVLRDEFNSSITSMMPALEVLREARARRRILVVGDVVDGHPRTSERLRQVGRSVVGMADLVVFIGRHAGTSRNAAVAAGLDAAAAVIFRQLWPAAEYLRREIRAGDLILLRGTEQRHHERIYFRLIGEVTCELSRCPIHGPCDRCPQLGFQPFDASRIAAAKPSSP